MKPSDNNIGTQDLEKGLRPSSTFTFPTIAIIALVMLLIFNSAGLASWTRQLSPGLVNSWLAERASDWHRLMVHLGPAILYDEAKRLFRIT